LRAFRRIALSAMGTKVAGSLAASLALLR
jgi:hypothetical protein